MEPIREIPQRELRNDVAKVLREVAAGERLRVTVRGKPVADIVPVETAPKATPWHLVEPIILQASLDRAFGAEVDEALGTTDEL